MNACQSLKTAHPAPSLPVWQRGGLTTISGVVLVGLVALPAYHPRVAAFGVRQPYCRTCRAHDPARVIPFTLGHGDAECARHDYGVCQ